MTEASPSLNTKEGREVSVDTSGGMIVNDHLSMLALAKSGVGLAYTGENVAKAALKAGSLESVLADFCPTNPGMFLYFPARSQQQPKLRAFIDFVTHALGKMQEALCPRLKWPQRNLGPPLTYLILLCT